jgi:hypothetical protein
LGKNASIPLREITKVVFDGAILIVEQANQTELTAKAYFQGLYNRIEVEVHVHLAGLPSRVNTPEPPFKGAIDLVIGINFYSYWHILYIICRTGRPASCATGSARKLSMTPSLCCFGELISTLKSQQCK